MMYNHMDLPEDEAWDVMVQDIQKAIAHRGAVEKENLYAHNLMSLPCHN